MLYLQAIVSSSLFHCMCPFSLPNQGFVCLQAIVTSLLSLHSSVPFRNLEYYQGVPRAIFPQRIDTGGQFFLQKFPLAEAGRSRQNTFPLRRLVIYFYAENTFHSRRKIVTNQNITKYFDIYIELKIFHSIYTHTHTHTHTHTP